MIAASRGGPIAQARELLEMIKFQHSIFALPFAFVGMLAAARGLPDMRTFLLIVACMVSARTAAMTWNRIADARFDARNPRTKDRALPAGRVSRGAAIAMLVLAGVAFVASAAALNRLTLLLSPVALIVVLGYSHAKRFTWATHFILGLALALAPVGAWVAVTGALSTEPLVLGLGVLAWVAGFDQLYGCQDVAFDRAHGLHSLPARFGVGRALTSARACHVVAVATLALFGVAVGFGPGYFVAVAAAAAVMAWSHSIVSEEDLSRVGLAFFQANLAVSLMLLAGTAWETLR